jgi:hypothetical protein
MKSAQFSGAARARGRAGPAPGGGDCDPGRKHRDPRGADVPRTIPIVMVSTFDPVGHGFIASLARPGGISKA